MIGASAAVLTAASGTSEAWGGVDAVRLATAIAPDLSPLWRMKIAKTPATEAMTASEIGGMCHLMKSGLMASSTIADSAAVSARLSDAGSFRCRAA